MCRLSAAVPCRLSRRVSSEARRCATTTANGDIPTLDVFVTRPQSEGWLQGPLRIARSPGSGDPQRAALAAAFTSVRSTVSSAASAMASQLIADRSCMIRRLSKSVFAAASRWAAASARYVSAVVMQAAYRKHLETSSNLAARRWQSRRNNHENGDRGRPFTYHSRLVANNTAAQRNQDCGDTVVPRASKKAGNISRRNLMTGAAASACYPPPPRVPRAQVELDVHDPSARLKAFGKQRHRHEPTM
jgi:hypothetical protein